MRADEDADLINTLHAAEKTHVVAHDEVENNLRNEASKTVSI